MSFKFLVFVYLIVTLAQEILSCSVNIRIEPMYLVKGKHYIKTHNNITFTAEVQKPAPDLTYEWYSKNQTLPGNSSQITHIFDAVDEDGSIKVVVRRVNKTEECFNEKHLGIRNEINIIKKEIKQHIYHGDLFGASFVFNGTVPVDYSYQLCHNSTHNRNCYSAITHFNYEGNEIKTLDYYLHVGNYVLHFHINNYASDVSQNIAIKVIETARKQRVNYVPITSSILAVLILLTGLALNVKFKKSVCTETADFDFTRNIYEDEEWDEVQTFGERLRYLLFGLNRTEQKGLLSSDLNRSRARLIP